MIYSKGQDLFQEAEVQPGLYRADLAIPASLLDPGKQIPCREMTTALCGSCWNQTQILWGVEGAFIFISSLSIQQTPGP